MYRYYTSYGVLIYVFTNMNSLFHVQTGVCKMVLTLPPDGVV